MENLLKKITQSNEDLPLCRYFVVDIAGDKTIMTRFPDSSIDCNLGIFKESLLIANKLIVTGSWGIPIECKIYEEIFLN